MVHQSAVHLPVAGWSEHASLPELGIDSIAVKLDTGAKTSALHVVNLEEFKKEGKKWLRFGVPPIQNDDYLIVMCEAPLHKTRTKGKG